MADLLKRIARIARARMPKPSDLLDRWAQRRGYRIDPEADADRNEEDGRARTESRASGTSRGNDPFPGVPRQVVEDLSVFGLAPPSSLAEVRKARNREIKKYHSDRFVNDSERYETSNRIMQIYNAAYDRLKAHFEVEKGSE